MDNTSVDVDTTDDTAFSNALLCSDTWAELLCSDMWAEQSVVKSYVGSLGCTTALFQARVMVGRSVHSEVTAGEVELSFGLADAFVHDE